MMEGSKEMIRGNKNGDIDKVSEFIKESVNRLFKDPRYISWQNRSDIRPNRYVAINNSFILRSRKLFKTNKSNKILALHVNDEGEFDPEPLVLLNKYITNDFQTFTPGKIAEAQTLNDAIKLELKELGSVVFILIGEIDNTVSNRIRIDFKPFEEVRWDPNLSTNTKIDNGTIYIKDIYDEETNWKEISSNYDNDEEWKRVEKLLPGSKPRDKDAFLKELRNVVNRAYEALIDEAYSVLLIPEKDSGLTDESMIDRIVRVLRKGCLDYEAALKKLKPTSSGNEFTEILRIAYNFSSDATTFFRLLVSICDLKPIVMWGTIAEHFAFSEALKDLPWSRPYYKASLDTYISTISDSRNRAFHNIFPFQKSLYVMLPEDALQEVSLRIFSVHGKSSDNELKFKDKELVDVLVEFTRAREVAVSINFWKKNLNIMRAIIDLFDKTGEFLKILRCAAP